MKVAIYCRLSDEDKNKQSSTDDSESIQNQKSLLLQFAVEKEWNVYNIYSDDDYAGADRNRPAFKQLLDDAELRKFDIILCKTQSRFTRELELVEKYIHGLFPKWGIRFISIVDNADTDIRGNKKARQINGLINEWYLEDMSENIKSVLTNKRMNGQHIGAFALYGYRKDPLQKGHLVIDEESAEVVREVFTLFARGYGKTTIARMLNDQGIPNPTEYKRLQGLRYKSGKSKTSTTWKYFAIGKMLTNEIYIGHMVQGKYTSVSFKTKENRPVAREKWIKVANTHEPIIDLELWNTVQDLISQKAKPFSTGTIGIFARKAKCQYCGYTMRSCKNHGNYYLQCSIKHTAQDACIGSFVSVSKLEKFVLSELHQLMDQYLDQSLLEASINFNSKIDEQIEKLSRQIKVYEQKLAEFSNTTRTLYVDRVKGIITEDEFVRFSKEFGEERAKSEKILKEIKDEIDFLTLKRCSPENNRELILSHTKLEKLSREVVEKLIDEIIVGKRDPVTRLVPLEISWKF